jgi:hypothetical protein
MVIAGMIASSLSKSHLSRPPSLLKKSSRAPSSEANEDPDTAGKKPEAPEKSPASEDTPRHKNLRRPDGAFKAHARRMDIFRKSHS